MRRNTSIAGSFSIVVVEIGTVNEKVSTTTMEKLPAILVFLLIMRCDMAEASGVKASRFRRAATLQSVISYAVVMSERSSIGCVSSCSRYSHCNTCAFDGESGTCYIQPVIANGLVGKFAVYVDKTPVCLEDDAPPLPLTLNNPTVTWRRTLTSLEGDVTCDVDYLYDSDTNPVMRCLASGQWETENADGNCVQRTWRQPTMIQNGVRYPVPRTPRPGWKVCITGVPTQDTRFVINFLDSFSGYIFHFDNRLNYATIYQTTVLDSNVNGVWGQNRQFVTPRPFPFIKGQQFHVNFTAVDMYTLEVDVNGERYATYTGTPAALDTVAGVETVMDVRIKELHLWCE
ncbi:hypothetical protein BaRGS_00034506 [Batillaria attramentaria]|uniref:Galectin n=1 Tax=Batillaria attramentaria TaxID=370345 RepID=A0ABD0JH27_9CAEN